MLITNIQITLFSYIYRNLLNSSTRLGVKPSWCNEARVQNKFPTLYDTAHSDVFIRFKF